MPEFHVVHTNRCRARIDPRIRFPVGPPSERLELCGEYRQGLGGIQIPVGLRTVGSLEAENREQAEEQARHGTMKWVLVACFSVGVEIGGMPRLMAVLEPLGDRTSFKFTQFFYDLHDIPPTLPVTFEGLNQINEGLRRVAGDETLSRRLELAMRWHTVGLGEFDSVSRFQSYWIALEVLGPAVDDRFHPVRRAACQICGTSPGEERKKHVAGMDHVLAIVSGDRGLRGRLKTVRDDIFHGRRDLRELEGGVDEGRKFLPDAVGRSILELLAPPEGDGDYTAGAPMPIAELPHAQYDCTLIEPTEEHIKQVKYRSLLTPLFEVVSVETDGDGEVQMRARMEVVGPPDLRIADDRLTYLPQPLLTITDVAARPQSGEAVS